MRFNLDCFMRHTMIVQFICKSTTEMNILTSRAFLVDFHTELAWGVGLKAVTIYHGVDGGVEGSFLWAKVRILLAITLVTLNG